MNQDAALTYERHADKDHSMWYHSDLFTFLAEGKDTGGRFTLIEFAPKRGLEPPPHTKIEREVSDLYKRGLRFEEYDCPSLKTAGGIAESAAGRAAWFKDSEGNLIGLIQFC